MLLKSVAYRYAQALYQMAETSNRIDAQILELVKVSTAISTNPNLRRALQSPTIPAVVKKAILRRLLEGRVESVTLHFFFVLVDKNREVYADSILEAFKQIVREKRDQIEVTVQLASGLTPGLESDLKKTLQVHTGKSVSLRVEEVPELLGGLVLLIGDRVVDGSLRTQLARIQERLIKTQAAAVGG